MVMLDASSVCLRLTIMPQNSVGALRRMDQTQLKLHSKSKVPSTHSCRTVAVPVITVGIVVPNALPERGSFRSSAAAIGICWAATQCILQRNCWRAPDAHKSDSSGGFVHVVCVGFHFRSSETLQVCVCVPACVWVRFCYSEIR